MKRSGKLSVIITALCFAFILSGFSLNSDVKFVSEGKKLLDLDKAVKTLPIGYGEKEDPEEAEDTVSEDGMEMETVTVAVRGESIMLNGQTVSVKEINDLFSSDREWPGPVVLSDDYAESGTYREVMKILDETGAGYITREER